MRAVVYRGTKQVAVEQVPDARVEAPVAAVVRITTAGPGPGRPVVGRHAGRATPSFIVSHELPLDQAPEGYEKFDNREDSWTEVLLHP